MRAFILKTLWVLLIMYGGCSSTSAQNAVLLKDESNLSVSGTSNLHDWEVKAEDFSVDLELGSEATVAPVIEKVRLLCKAASITSDNSIMTNKTRDALKPDKNPEIMFRSDDPSSLTVSNGHFSSTITGDLTINGVKRKVTVPFEGTITGNKMIVKGSKSLKMGDFSIKPPTAIMGALKTDETITVTFDFSFNVPEENMATLSTVKQ